MIRHPWRGDIYSNEREKGLITKAQTSSARLYFVVSLITSSLFVSLSLSLSLGSARLLPRSCSSSPSPKSSSPNRSTIKSGGRTRVSPEQRKATQRATRAAKPQISDDARKLASDSAKSNTGQFTPRSRAMAAQKANKEGKSTIKYKGDMYKVPKNLPALPTPKPKTTPSKFKKGTRISYAERFKEIEQEKKRGK